MELEEKNDNTIFVCLGNSCKKNDNEKYALALEKVLNTKIDLPKETDSIKLFSCHCLGQCSYGPNIKANEKIHNKVDKELLKRILVNMTNKINQQK
ncbi:MAG: NAD(P)H-dependent oxidoreductase subunit E [Candidatus Sericytochromatia bacterium]